MLLSREEISQIRLMTPKGIELYLDIEEITRGEDYVECAVRKYSGDDPDVTDGLLVFARVERENGISASVIHKNQNAVRDRGLAENSCISGENQDRRGKRSGKSYKTRAGAGDRTGGHQ